MPNLENLSSGVPPVGVLIPTYNRSKDLVRTLDHLAAQTYPHFEVVIVNDGSTDDTVAQVERYCRDAPFKITLISQQNAGPAVARNLGIANMRTPVCVLIGDDTYPAGDFLRLHHEFHQRNTRSESIALGYTRYSEAYQRVTPLMRWLNSDGVQFAYGELIAGQPPTWHHFYTSNLSFKTAHLRRNQFNESFRYAAMEDLELGYRLHLRNELQIEFLPAAIADHVHPISFSQVCSRSEKVGESFYRFAELWPEQRPQFRTGGLFAGVVTLLTSRALWPMFSGVMDRMTRVRLPGRILHVLVDHFRAKGYRQAASARRTKLQ